MADREGTTRREDSKRREDGKRREESQRDRERRAERGRRLDQPRSVRRGPRAPSYSPESFGRLAESVARYLGTARFLVIQTGIILLWIVVNAIPGLPHFDRYPFQFLTLVLSLQAAYAAPLILLAQTRQADRDKAHVEFEERHHEQLSQQALERTEELKALLEANTDLTRQDKELTQQIADLTREIHARLGTASS